MEFLTQEINNLKRKAPTASQNTHQRRSELEARRQEQYKLEQEKIELQKKLREDQKLERLKTYEEAKQQKAKVKQEQQHAKAIDIDAVYKDLQSMEQPIRLFGETPEETLNRLETYKSSQSAGTGIEGIDVYKCPADEDLPSEESLDINANTISSEEGRAQTCQTIFLYLRIKIRDWLAKVHADDRRLQGTSESNNPVLIATTSRTHMRHLLMRLKAGSLPIDILKNITNIVIALKSSNFTAANHAYLQMSIGKATWPVGVTMVSIHERALKARAHGEMDSAHILSDEMTRQWLQSLKRLITHCERAD